MIGYGYGTGYKDTVCTLMLSKKGVKIGFYKGALLPDPQQLLTGTGKVHRFVELKNAEGPDGRLDDLITAALQAWRERTPA